MRASTSKCVGIRSHLSSISNDDYVIDFILQKRNDLQPALSSANIKHSSAAASTSKNKWSVRH